MTPRDVLADRVRQLAAATVADPRFARDDLSVSVLGMLLYGYALAAGRWVLFLDVPDIEAVVAGALAEGVGASARWVAGLVAEAGAAATDPAHHPGHHALIEFGHTYVGTTDLLVLVDNVIANVDGVRARIAGSA